MLTICWGHIVSMPVEADSAPMGVAQLLRAVVTARMGGGWVWSFFCLRVQMVLLFHIWVHGLDTCINRCIYAWKPSRTEYVSIMISLVGTGRFSIRLA